LSFLIAGHTHEDIDQMFSNFWKKLWKRMTLSTVDAFSAAIQDFYPEKATRPCLFKLLAVWDWKSFFTQHLNDIKVIESFFSSFLSFLCNLSTGDQSTTWIHYFQTSLWSCGYPTCWLSFKGDPNNWRSC
jgi:hypothetical protein